MGVYTVTCPKCEGDGVVPDAALDGFLDAQCPACDGDGYLDVDVEDEE